MRTVWRYLTYWPHGWLAVPFGVVLAFCGGLFAGMVLLGREASEAMPMAAAVAVGAGVGQVWRILRPTPPKEPAWPAQAPPHGRRD